MWLLVSIFLKNMTRSKLLIVFCQLTNRTKLLSALIRAAFHLLLQLFTTHLTNYKHFIYVYFLYLFFKAGFAKCVRSHKPLLIKTNAWSKWTNKENLSLGKTRRGPLFRAVHYNKTANRGYKSEIQTFAMIIHNIRHAKISKMNPHRQYVEIQSISSQCRE